VHLGWGLVGVWYALSAKQIVRGLSFTARFFHGGWAKVKV